MTDPERMRLELDERRGRAAYVNAAAGAYNRPLWRPTRATTPSAAKRRSGA